MLLALAALAAGCGGGDSSTGTATAGPRTPNNGAKIRQAAQSEAHAHEIHSKLDSALNLHSDGGVNDVYKLSDGNLCTIEGIYVGDQVQLYESKQGALISPDGSALVDVNVFQGSSLSKCMIAAKDALGW